MIILQLITAIVITGYIFQVIAVLQCLSLDFYSTKREFLFDLIPGYPIYKKFKELV